MPSCRATETDELARLRSQKMTGVVCPAAWLRDAVLRTARVMAGSSGVTPTLRAGSGAELSFYTDAHMLSDIGLAADAIRRDPPRQVWPN